MDKKNYVLVTIHADGRTSKLVQKYEPKLNQLQKIVGGYIQEIPRFNELALQDGDKVFGYNRGRCYANEEGKMPHFQLPVNSRATEAWRGQYNIDQWLVGDIVFVARTTEPCTTS